jgi:hypothetical protein
MLVDQSIAESKNEKRVRSAHNHAEGDANPRHWSAPSGISCGSSHDAKHSGSCCNQSKPRSAEIVTIDDDVRCRRVSSTSSANHNNPFAAPESENTRPDVVEEHSHLVQRAHSLGSSRGATGTSLLPPTREEETTDGISGDTIAKPINSCRAAAV